MKKKHQNLKRPPTWLKQYTNDGHEIEQPESENKTYPKHYKAYT